MERVTTGALVLIALCAMVIGSVVASDLDAMWMSLTPEGPAQTDFPSGTETVYVVFEYTDFVSENVRVIVSDHTGTIVSQATRTFSGSGVGSISVDYGQSAFPDGPYVTTLYFAGQYLTQAVEWTVGGVDSPPTPTAFPPARLEVKPATLTFGALQGGPNPSAQRVLVSNSTASASAWQATTNAPWLRVTPEGGETPVLLRISVDVAGLPAGTYAGHVTISADGIEGSPQTVAVTLTVSPPLGTTTLDLSAIADGTGWVVSDEPSANHFGESEIRVGFQAGREYLGGLQFDTSTGLSTSLSEIPDGSNIRAAAVILSGLRWETEPSTGHWTLELIDGDLAQEWTDSDYSDITKAAASVVLVPGHSVSSLGPGNESVWHLDNTGLDVLESHIRESDFGVMRLRYAPSPAQSSGVNADAEDGLFVWNAAGIFRVNFQPGTEPVEMATSTMGHAGANADRSLPTVTPLVPSPALFGRLGILSEGRGPLGFAVTDLAWPLAVCSVFWLLFRELPDKY
ncbi:MAG: hypothetical protein ACE5LU_17680 [Anaerolineae bacterium]